MQHITPQDVQSLSLGSVFFGTGGGSTIAEHREAFDRAFSRTSTILLADIDEFQPTDILISVYMVGDPSQALSDIPTLLTQAIGAFTNRSGLSPAGIIPGELGCIETAFEVASATRLPVVNSDLVGGRAAPEMTLDTFTIHERHITPLLALGNDGSQLYYGDETPTAQIEQEVRAFAAAHGGLSIVVGYAISASEYAAIGMRNTVSHAQRVGEVLHSHSLASLLIECDGTLICTEQLTNVDLRSQHGFLMGTLQLERHALHVKNEHMILELSGDIIGFAPDLFILLDHDTLTPIHNAQAERYINHTVSLISIEAKGYWQTEHGQSAWKRSMASS